MADEPGSTIATGMFGVARLFFRHSALWLLVFFLGKYSFNPAWMLTPLVVATLREHWRHVRREKLLDESSEEAVMAQKKDVILARVQDLPPWVFYPDFQRAEWINRILGQLWPNVESYVQILLKQQIEPMVASTLEGYSLSGFEFSRVELGRIPPRIGGIKAYERNVSRKEIVLDMELSWASDCDIHLSMGRRIRATIKEVYISGTVRLVFTPLIQDMPLIGGVQVFFLNNPNLDFDLGGIANVADAPGISRVIRKVIIEQIAAFIVLPNKFYFPLVENPLEKAYKCAPPAGILRLNVVRGVDLMKMDFGLMGRGKSDPYAVIKFGSFEFKTKTVKESLDPSWNFICEFPVSEIQGKAVTVEVWDYDKGMEDEFMGRAVIPVSSFHRKGHSDFWATLEDAKSGKVHLKADWMDVTKDYEDFVDREDEVRGLGLSTAVLLVFLDSCRELPVPKGSKLTKPCPYVQLSLIGQDPVDTWPAQYTVNPVWEASFPFLVKNPESDDLYVRVFDRKNKVELGCMKFPLCNLLNRSNYEFKRQPFKLKNSGSESVVVLSLQLLFTKKLGPPDCEPTVESQKKAQSPLRQNSLIALTDELPFEVVPQIKLSFHYMWDDARMVVCVHRLCHLPSGGSDLPDPYVKLFLLPDKSKVSKRKTKVIKDSVNPEFEETFSYLMTPNELEVNQLEVIVADKKGAFAKSADVGSLIINLTEVDFTEKHARWYKIEMMS